MIALSLSTIAILLTLFFAWRIGRRSPTTILPPPSTPIYASAVSSVAFPISWQSDNRLPQIIEVPMRWDWPPPPWCSRP